MQGAQTFAFRDAPDSGSGVVTAGCDQISMDFDTPHTCLVAEQDVLAETSCNIPDSERRVSRSRDSRVGIAHFQTTHSRAVSAQSV